MEQTKDNNKVSKFLTQKIVIFNRSNLIAVAICNKVLQNWPESPQQFAPQCYVITLLYGDSSLSFRGIAQKKSSPR